jgi:hypothetical protein
MVELRFPLDACLTARRTALKVERVMKNASGSIRQDGGQSPSAAAGWDIRAIHWLSLRPFWAYPVVVALGLVILYGLAAVGALPREVYDALRSYTPLR